MAYLFELPNASAGFDGLMVDLAMEINVFTPMIIIFLWSVIFMGGSSAQMLKRGYADYPIWSVVASLTTIMVALMMTVSTGVINPLTLGASFGLTLLSGLWFFLSKGRFEN